MNQHKRKDIKKYKHEDKTRPNNPQVGMVSEANDPYGNKKLYAYDPDLDPTLVWAGKKEQSELDVDTVSIHVHERIDPKTIVHQVHKNSINSYADYQPSLFEQPFEHRSVRDEVSFYQHKNAWANRLIAGDSLLVMNSLLEKEGMAGQVQMVYFDPPYGIKYGSNFQPYTNQKSVTNDNDRNLSSEPEMIKAFRDTWELGIHSYLSYLRDRLMLSYQLLDESGSVFVQISEENVHHVRELLDDIFGSKNFVSQINIKRASVMFSKKYLNTACYYVVWYAKKIDKLKYRDLYTKRGVKDFANNSGSHLWVERKDGRESRKATPKERADIDSFLTANPDYRIFGTLSINAQGVEKRNPFTFNGTDYYPPAGTQWKTSYTGLEKLADMNRLAVEGNTVRYKQYFDDYPVLPINSLWSGIGAASDKVYVVQTSDEIIKRCLLMCTDPGDLVIDPTCGSGTSAYVAEQWGRRWITVDTSRIAIQLAKQRLMTSVHNWYKLAHENEGVGGGFVYKKAPHITLGSIANNEPTSNEVIYDSPLIDKSIVRVSGPFTVEAIPAITVKPLEEIVNSEDADNSLSRTGETIRQDDWRNELLKTGVRAKDGNEIEFTRVELVQGTRYIHAEAETMDDKRVLVSFGPDDAPLEQKQVEMALEEASQCKPAPQIVLFAAFQFDPEASKDIDETNWAGVKLLKVQMNTDLLTSDLKKSQSSSESFWLVGQPDVNVTKNGTKYVVNVEGFDYYNPNSGEVQSGGKKEISMWMLDTDYDGRSIFPTQVFFPMAGAKDGWKKLAKNLKAELDEDLVDKFEGTESIAFDAGDYKRCAIKIIDNRGIESLIIKNLE